MSEQVLNWFSSMQFLETTYLGMQAYSGAAFVSDVVSASEMTYIVSGGALNSTHSLSFIQ